MCKFQQNGKKVSPVVISSLFLITYAFKSYLKTVPKRSLRTFLFSLLKVFQLDFTLRNVVRHFPVTPVTTASLAFSLPYHLAY